MRPYLLLDGHDLQDLILQLATQEVVDDLVLLDGQREQVDVLERRDLAFLDKTTQLGHGHPLCRRKSNPSDKTIG